MSADDGHKDSFGPPKGGWPSFEPDGRLSRSCNEEAPCDACLPAPAKDAHGVPYAPRRP